MNQPPRRRPSSSRTTTSRPRKIAGRGPAEEEQPTERLVPGAGRSTRRPAGTDRGRPEGPKRSRRWHWPAWVASEGLTLALLGVLALVLVAGLALSGLLVYDRFAGGDSDEVAADTPEGQIAVPSGRPVVADELAWQEGVDAAAKAAQEIVAVNHAKYDAEVDKASELMTDDFAETYRQTAADVRDQIIERKTVVQARVAAQGVVRANETELQALIFLNQIVQREDKDGPTTVVTPYKVLVTMVHTDNGWFVDRLDTDDAAPATGGQPASPAEPSSGEPSPTTGE